MTESYMDTKALKLDYLPQPVTRDGVQCFDNPNDMYLACTYDMLANSKVISRKGRLYMSRKPYALTVDNTEYAYITMPGSNYHDRPAWMMWELMDFFLGEEVVGGYSIAWDKHRRTVYPKGNGESDWAYKKALGAMNEGQVWWALRSLRMDSASRNCVIAPWHAERDLKKYVMNKENDLQRGDTYQRLPCITTAQFSQREGGKMLDSFQYQRSLDFTGAIHTDLWRFSEVADWLARCSYPFGYGGASTIFIGTAAIESYGASAFVKFNKALEWWCSNDNQEMRNLQLLWSSHKDGYSYTEANKPNVKQYEWYMSEFDKLSVAARHIYYCRFEEAVEVLESILYLYYKDWGYALLCFVMALMLDRKEQFTHKLFDNQKVLKAYDFISSNGLVTMLGKVTNYYQYYVAVELLGTFIDLQDYDGVLETLNVMPSEAAQVGTLIDAMLYIPKRPRTKLKENLPDLADIVDFYEEVFG